MITPLPEPRPDETEEDFMDRCTDADTMKDEFEDEDQIVAVCQNIWDEKGSGRGDIGVKNKEIRMIIANIETRQTDSDEQDRVSGFGLVYEEEVELFPGFIEIIRKDAFKESLERERDRPIKSYFNHDPSNVLATTVSEPPLVVQNKDEGVFYEAEIPDTTYGKDLKINLARKNVQGSSFAFDIPTEDGENLWEDEDGVVHREIIKGELYELGPVTDPAYLQAEAGLRSAEKMLKEYRKKTKRNKKSKIFIMRKRLELKSKLY